MQVLIIFALVCCLSVLTVSSKRQIEEEDNFDAAEGPSMDAEDERALYEDILDELIAAADPKAQRDKLCRRWRCAGGCRCTFFRSRDCGAPDRCGRS